MGTASKSFALVLVALFLTSLVVLPSATLRAQSKTITVPDDYPTIQSAVGNASAGDTVFVRRGIYNLTLGGLNIDKSLSLIGEDSNTTIINNPNRVNFWNSVVIWVKSENVTISGFTITGKNLHGIVIDLDNPYADVSGTRIIRNKIIGNNIGIVHQNLDGNLARVIPSFDFISGNIISKNRAGIFFGSSNSTIEGNSIADNEDYGIAVGECSNVTIAGNVLSNNTQGGLSLGSWGPFYVYHNNITDSNGGYGIQFGGSSNSTVYGNSIVNNKVGVRVRNYQLFNYSSSVGTGNKIYYNNLNNSLNAFIETSYYNVTYDYGEIGNGTDVVSWDNGVIGNYWGDYKGKGFYVIDQNNVDHYPLTQQVNISSSAPTPTPIQPNMVLILPIAVTVVALAVVVSLLLYRKQRKTQGSNTRT